jgi:hypothetical protein
LLWTLKPVWRQWRQGKADELFPQQQGEDIVGEDFKLKTCGSVQEFHE